MYDWAPIKAISQVFWFLLQWIHNFIPSYGWSIILLTIIFRAFLLPLDLKQKISMKKMSLVQPKIAALNEKYKNDKEKAAQATMALYKEEKVSPFSGCLPSLLQMFLFFAFYGALQIVANGQLSLMYKEMQDLFTQYGSNIPTNLLPHVEGWLWIHNVWQPDTALFSSAPQAGALTFMGMDSHIIPPFHSLAQFKDFKGILEADYLKFMKPLMDAHSSNWNGWFVMPILAGVSSFFQMKITMPPQQANPDPKAGGQPNPLNSKMFMYLFPLMSVYFSAVSNSIFALYWFTSNVCVTITYKAFDIYWNAKMKKEEAEKKDRLEQQQKEEAERIAAAAALKAARAEAKTKAKEGKK